MPHEFYPGASNVADEVALGVLDISTLDGIEKQVVLGVDYPHPLGSGDLHEEPSIML
jgi:hypothetical protein